MAFDGHVVQARYAARAAAFVTLAAGALAGALAGAQERGSAPVSPLRLPEGRAATAQQRSGENVAYMFDAVAGRTYLVEVEQRGLDFSVTIDGPDGDTHAFNSPLFRDESELALIENARGGLYRITIAANEPTNAVGSHAVTVSPLDVSDSRAIDAWRRMSEGGRANKESRGKDSLSSYERAATLWHDLGDVRHEAQALFSAAMVRYWSIYDWGGAAKQAAAAAALYAKTGARDLYADAMLALGYSLMEVAQGAGTDAKRAFDDALAALRASYAVHQSLGNDYGVAQVENFTGLAYYNRGQAETQDFRQAETHYRDAIELFARLGEWREELNSRQNLAMISADEGRAASAARLLEQIIADIPEGGDLAFRGRVLANLGLAYRDSAEFDSALRVLSEAVKINASVNQFDFEGFALRVLGSVYQALGEFDRAAEYLRQALEKSPDDARVRSSVLAGLGNVAYERGDYAAALDWHRRSVESTASGVNRTNREAFVAKDLVALGRFDDAIKVAGAALARADTTPIARADSALELGHAYLGLGQPREADRNFATALSVYEAGGLRAEQAEALRGRALATRASGDLRAAIRYGEQSLQSIEALRTNVGAPDLRAFYSGAHRIYYEQQIERLVAAYRAPRVSSPDWLSAALAVSERGRARMLVDLLAEASIRLDSGVPQAVLDHERDLYDELGVLRNQRDRLLERSVSDHADLDAVVERMAAIENELSLVAMDARNGAAARPKVAAIAPLGARAIQESLDGRSVLVQYALGTDTSFAFVVTRESIQLAELGGRDAIEAAARRAQENLKTYRPGRSGEELGAALRTLSGLVLAPILPYLGSHQRVIVAADGALDYVPFGVLPLARDGGAVPMLETLEVVNVPSMSVMAAQERRTEGNPTKTLAVFADPVFSADDPRLPPRNAAAPIALLADPARVPRLERLAATGAEATAIAELVPPGSRLVVTGLDASRERVLSTSLDDYRIVHFATHGLVDSQYPGLSALVLSQIDPAGRSEDGLLRLQDIYRLNLNADLVVLSGCDTALGRHVRGEGLIGLVDGFLYAGARNLVVSLWQVPDRATGELMRRFYGYVLKEHVPPAEALRRAQRSIAAERRWSDPYFWGAFIVVGDS